MATTVTALFFWLEYFHSKDQTALWGAIGITILAFLTGAARQRIG